MGKKKKEEMAAQRAKFLNGCANNKIPEKKAERIFNLMKNLRDTDLTSRTLVPMRYSRIRRRS